MNAKSSPERSRLNREIARGSGFTELKMIARSDRDLQEIEKMKHDQLERFIQERPENALLSPAVRRAVHDALMQKGAPAYVSTHGAFSTVLTTMMEDNLTAQVVPSVAIYSACYPTSLNYVLKSFPGKVYNYLCRHADSGAVLDWTEQNPDWEDRTVTAVLNGTFDDVLYQMRTAVGAMKMNQPVLTLLRRLKDEAVDIGEGALAEARKILDDAPDTLCQSPRQWNPECNALRTFVQFFLLADLEQRFGPIPARERTFGTPFYSWSREAADLHATGVVSFSEDSVLAANYDYGLCIGWRYDQWEQFFYQACMGAVFLLNPRIAPIGTLKSSALEAGVAIHYAEKMLQTYLPYTGRKLVDSPVGTGNAFDVAYQAARKLPDEALLQIRQVFGSFGAISDLERFTVMTSQWLTPDESRLLKEDFCWYARH